MSKFKAIAAAVLVFALSLGAVPAYANESSTKSNTQVLDYRPTQNPVADRAVHLKVNKLDKDTREYVEGSVLQILDGETGEVVMEWTSGEEGYESERQLDVDHTYILHEVSAPNGYALADDVEFVLRSEDFETKGEVKSGETTADGETNAEFNNVAGDIETQAFVISLFDAELANEETITEHRQRVHNNEKETSNEETKERTNTESRSDEKTNVNSRNTTEEESDSRTLYNSRTKTTESETTTYDEDARYTENANTTGTGRRGTGGLTKTGDETAVLPVVVVALVGIVIVAVGVIRRKR